MDVGEFRYTVERHKKATRATSKKGEKAAVGKGTGRLLMALVARLIDG